MVSAKYPRLVPQTSHDAVREDMSSYMGIHCSQWVIQEVDCLILGGESDGRMYEQMDRAREGESEGEDGKTIVV